MTRFTMFMRGASVSVLVAMSAVPAHAGWGKADRAHADTAHVRTALHACEARHERRKHERRNDHPDQAQENIGDDRKVAGDRFGRRRVARTGVAQTACNDSEHHAGSNI